MPSPPSSECLTSSAKRAKLLSKGSTLSKKLAESVAKSAGAAAAKLKARMEVMQKKLDVVQEMSDKTLNLARMERILEWLADNSDSFNYPVELWPDKIIEYLLVNPKELWHRLSLYKFFHHNGFMECGPRAELLVDVVDIKDGVVVTGGHDQVLEEDVWHVKKVYDIPSALWIDV